LDRDLSIIAQNAGSTAAAILGPVQGDLNEYLAAYDHVRQHVFSGTLALAGGQQPLSVAQVAASLGATPVAAAPAPAAPAAPAAAPAGVPFADEVVNFGKHRGKTLAAIDAIPADSKGQNSGRSYLEWLRDNTNNAGMKSKVTAYLAAA